MNQNSLHQQESDFEIINKLIPYLTHRNFLDIGAEKGAFAAPLIEKGLTGVLFEPLDKHESELKALVENTANVFLSYAVDSSDRTANFYIACDEQDNPLDYFHSLQPLSNDERINHKKSVTVQCRSLDSLAAEGIIAKQIGILKTDTEGNDLHVLKGMHDITAEVLICEYFMPGIYAGWEQGHPTGLIEEAKKLGFNHFVAIKRIYEYEFISIDNPDFCDKQWGNLIFMSDAIFERSKAEIEKIISSKELQLHQSIIRYTEMLQTEIGVLRKACDERLAAINALSEAAAQHRKVLDMSHLNPQHKKWLKKFNIVNRLNGLIRRDAR